MGDGNRAALVTGASRGIGRVIAVALATEGYDVAVTARSTDELSATADEVRAAGVRSVAVPADLRAWDDVRDLYATVVGELGDIDVLVNNAGLAGVEVPFVESEVGEWERILTVNLLAPMWLCRAVIPGMIEGGGGVVVNINSLGGTEAFPTQSAYAASKAGLCRLTDTLALELADIVQVFDVSPGLVRTAMTSGSMMWRDVPPEAWTSPDVVAATVVQLASGGFPGLSGRFVHAPTDDLAALAESITEGGRTLGLAAGYPGDPVAS